MKAALARRKALPVRSTGHDCGSRPQPTPTGQVDQAQAFTPFTPTWPRPPVFV